MLIDKLNKISAEAKGQFKPDLAEFGKNYRAISESALLEVLNPLFKKEGIAYSVIVEDQKLEIVKVNKATVQQLLFVANCKVRLVFESSDNPVGDKYESAVFEAWGMGVDFGDKATGKALTYAVKYALLKGLRLQYSDDPDAKASEPIEEKLKDVKESEKVQNVAPKSEKKNKTPEEPLISDKQRNYIRGLIISANMTDEEFNKKYGIYAYDEKLTMRKAREIIDDLNAIINESLPF